MINTTDIVKIIIYAVLSIFTSLIFCGKHTCLFNLILSISTSDIIIKRIPRNKKVIINIVKITYI